MNRTQNVKGFTIIEVVLVLAIAGLIFLMVFIALPALQAGQRDTARKSDASAVAAAVNSYSSNNRGAFPSDAQIKTQLGWVTTTSGGTTTTTPAGVSGNTTNITVVTTAGTTTTTALDGIVTVYKGYKCSSVAPAGSVTLAPGSGRQYATVTKLEGSNGTGYCLEG